MKIDVNKVVSAKYELFVEGENEGELELMERATEQEPLSFIYGVGMILPKFEEYLYGLEEGDDFEFTIDSEDGYGHYDKEDIIDLDRSIFETDGKLDNDVIFEGNVVTLMDNEGNRLPAKIVTITENYVTVDLNHPLADEKLHFKGTVLEVRDATEEELSSLSGCGCGCEADCDCESNHANNSNCSDCECN
ncbi:MAG TPA: FKBP-type peptidyl-prolyl cis-trans isomerase [Paludibacteraceae bacterium]|mgnify:FL=1|jgi:FKBP-type peptidyl-prolyl cis-trans isomerase SlyD|nr:FKBP-type peptidyl-prolyl cis-trans isomerase [Paludibacteraceae bacterium]